MKITRKILERIINEEVANLLQEQEINMSGGDIPVGGDGNRATIEGLDDSLRSIHEKLDRLLGAMNS
jgi:hypothetical protein